MACTKVSPAEGAARRRAVIVAALRRDAAEGFRRRLARCCRATECGRICERLVKAPSKALVWCVDPETSEKLPLYAALADPDFRCPLGLF